MSIKLEVGKKYLCRDGKTIVEPLTVDLCGTDGVETPWCVGVKIIYANKQVTLGKRTIDGLLHSIREPSQYDAVCELVPRRTIELDLSVIEAADGSLYWGLTQYQNLGDLSSNCRLVGQHKVVLTNNLECPDETTP